LRFGSFAKQRKKIIPLATGNVLEIGIGTGLNLPLYKRVIRLTAIDPSEDTWKKCTIDTKARIYFKFMIASAEELPFDDGFDTVVVTYSLCTIPNAKGIRRNEKSTETNRTSLFCEHGIAPEKVFKRYKT
jgi:ubiquinone/menaquinone biosynthesis C-methylase UbiE